MPNDLAVLSGELVIRLTESQLLSLIRQWQADGKPGDEMTFRLMAPKASDSEGP